MKSALRRPAIRRYKWRRSGQPRDARQGVAADAQAGGRTLFREAPRFHLAHRPTVVSPVDDLHSPVAQSQVRPVACMARGASFAGRVIQATVTGGDVRLGLAVPLRGNAVGGFIGFVYGVRTTAAPRQTVQHLQRRLALGEAARLCHLDINRQTGAVLHKQAAQVVQFGGRAFVPRD